MGEAARVPITTIPFTDLVAPDVVCSRRASAP